MIEENTDKTNKGKVEKVGPDGLTKKQRRALKVAAKGEPTTNSDNKASQKPAEKKIEKLDSSSSTKHRKSKENIPKTENIKTTAAAVNIQKEKTTEVQQPPEHIKEKSKAELKAERRLLQEKQRELKKQAQSTIEEKKNKETKSKEPPAVAVKHQSTPQKPKGVLKKQNINIELFNHLKVNAPSNSLIEDDNIYPSFKALAAKYASYTILGSNARCLALLAALHKLIEDFQTPPNQDLCRSLERTLDTNVEYLQKYRPPAVSMTNALRHFKMHALQIPPNISDTEKKATLIEIIKNYVQDEIQKAGEAISDSVRHKIADGDVILTYGCSSLITKILVEAKEHKKNFKVIIVDSRPLEEGLEMLRRLINADIECVYVLIGAASYVMSQASKVLLGAHALLANGYVMSRIGTAQIALTAKEYNVPVLVCCETYKFSERVQTDSYVYNEIGNPGKIMEVNHEDPNTFYIKPLNLLYDVTPSDFVTAVVTERGFLPCTSVPVILRIKPTE